MTGFEQVIDTLFVTNTEELYQEVLNGLAMAGKASRQDYGTLVDLLDASEEIARKALVLVANCKVANSNFQADAGVIEGELRNQASVEVVRIHKEQERKAPTIADIEAYMMSTYHDEYRALKQRIAKGKATYEYLEGLAALTAQRARDLRQMVASARGA